MKKVFLILFLFYITVAYAQKSRIDSLKKILATAKEDTNKLNALNELAWEYRTTTRDTVILLSMQAIELATAIVNKHSDQSDPISIAAQIGIGKANLYLGFFNGNKGNFSQSLNYNFKALAIWEKLEKKASTNYKLIVITQKCITLEHIGADYSDLGDYPQALNYDFKALKIVEKLGDKTGMEIGLGSIGAVYARQGIGHSNPSQKKVFFDKALDYDFKALKIAEELGDKDVMAIFLMNIGGIYTEKAYYVQALDYDLKALKIAEELGNKTTILETLGNIGSIYQDQQDYAKALNYNFKALKIAQELEEKNQILEILNNIGLIYLDQKKYKEAGNMLNRSLSLAKKIGNKEYIKSSYYELSQLDSSLGDYKNAYSRYKMYISHRDSMTNDEKIEKQTRIEMQYEFDKKEATAKLQQEKKEAVQRIEKYAFVSGFCLLIVFSFVLFNNYRLKEKSKFQQALGHEQKEKAIAVMETQEIERKRIAEDMHDSMGHLLSTAKINVLSLNPYDSNDNDKKQRYQNSLALLDEASGQIRQISYNLMPHMLEEEGLVPALEELFSKIRRAGTLKINFFKTELPLLEKLSQYNLYRISQELLNNIIKHAEATTINFQLLRDAQTLTLMVEDDGKGFDFNMAKAGDSRGLANIQTRVQWLNGKSSIDSSPGNGTTVIINIPL